MPSVFLSMNIVLTVKTLTDIGSRYILIFMEV